MRHKILMGRIILRILRDPMGADQGVKGPKPTSHPSTSKIPVRDNRMTRAFIQGRVKKARKRTKKMIAEAIRNGHTYIQHEVYGDIAAKAWMEIGWEPLHESWDRDIGGMKVTIRMRVPSVPWE